MTESDIHQPSDAQLWEELRAAKRAKEDQRLHEEEELATRDLRARLAETATRQQRVQQELSVINTQYFNQETRLAAVTLAFNAKRAALQASREEEDKKPVEWAQGYYRVAVADSTLSPEEGATDMNGPEDANGNGKANGNGVLYLQNSKDDANEGLAIRTRDPKESLESPDSTHGETPNSGGGFTAINGATPAPPNPSAIAVANKSKPRKSLPTKRKSAKKTPASPAILTPGTQSPGAAASDKENEDSGDLEIPRESLTLRHDGTVYTDPPMMLGVPVAKISPEHPYWDPEWQDVEEMVKATLDKWQARLDDHIAKGTTTSTKFLANRQVNRGRALLHYLQEGDIHPYQLVGKAFITRTFINYDTLFRMVQILEELEKFGISWPLDWLRHRLHEIYQVEGDSFNLAKAVAGLYGDRKLVHLRSKSGFGNIGRPAGLKAGDKLAETTPAQRKQARKRKKAEAEAMANSSPMVPLTTPSKKTRPKSEPEQVEGDLIEPSPSQRDFKRPRSDFDSETTQPPTPIDDELEYSGYTSTDSASNDRISNDEWRIEQIKLVHIATNVQVTQYWNWVAEEGFFQHQVLKDVLPDAVKWGVYTEPFNFHLRPAEIVEMTYAPSSLHVAVSIQPVEDIEYRGDTVLIAFKRARTKKRFLAFVKKLGVTVVRVHPEFMEDLWHKMQPDVLPITEDE